MISRLDFAFFCRNAGGVVGRNAVTALYLARAEQFMVDHGWQVEWVFDDSADLSWCTCHKNPKVHHEHEVLVCLLKDSAGEVISSLGNIVDADHHFARVTIAELALEAMGPQLEKDRDVAALDSRRDSLEFEQRFNMYRADDWECLSTYGNWHNADDGEYALLKLCGGSDYSGTLVERSNHDAWSEQFSESQDSWWRSVSGGHGTFAIVVKVAELPEEAIEFIEGLDSYCIADEDAHSKAEMAAQDEAWESYVRRDFARAIAARFNIEDADLTNAGDSILFDVFREACEESNTYWENQQGGDMYIDLDRVVAEVTAEQLDRIIADMPGPIQLPLPSVG